MGFNYPSRSTPRMDLGAALELHAAGENFIGTKILPALDVKDVKGYYPYIPAAVMIQNPDTKRAADGSYNEIELTAGDKSYECLEYGLGAKVDDSKRKYVESDFDLELLSAKVSRRALLLGQEIRIKDLLFNETTFSGYVTDYSATAPWSTSSSDAIEQIRTAITAIELRAGMPNALIIGLETLNELLNLSVVKDRFQGATTITRQMLEEMIAAVLGLEYLLVGREPYNSADQGQTMVASSVWGSTYALVARIAPSGGFMEPCLGCSPYWTPKAPIPFAVESYRDDSVQADKVRCYNAVDEVVHDAAFGQLLKI